MLSDEELEALFDGNQTPDQGRRRIRWIRQNAPIRRVDGGTKSVKVRYAPRKMPFVLEAEAFNTEYAALVTYDNDEETLEIYNQPAQLKISYINHKGKKVSPFITPDLFLIRNSGFRFEECKTEEELLKLARAEPTRYRVDETGRWRSPPAETAAAELGCGFSIRSTKENNWALIENLEFLRDYLTDRCPAVPDSEKESVLGYFKASAWATVSDLVQGNLKANADSIYTLIVQKKLYFDLFNDRLSDYERALVYRDQTSADAYRTFARSSSGLTNGSGGALELELGARFSWDGRGWEIINVGEHLVCARALDATDEKGRAIIEFPRDQLAQLAREGKISVPASAKETERIKSEAQEALSKCSPKQLEIANYRYQILFGPGDLSNNPVAARCTRAQAYWKASWRRAEQLYGYGFLGLIPNLEHKQGNKCRKITDTAIEHIEAVFYAHWAQPKRKRMKTIYGELRTLCRESGVEPPSLKTFRLEFAKLRSHKNLAKRLGEKGAYSEEPEYLALEYTTPRHGNRPFHIGHIDHTPLDIVLSDKDHKQTIITIWLTLLLDAYSRKVLAFFLSFDTPSYRSNMMVIRECVRTHGRLPDFIVVDRGSDFESTYFEQALARFERHKKTRPGAKPKFGSLIERFFRTTAEEFVYSLMGNTQAYENFRQVSPEVAPARHAIWTFERLAVRLEEYFDRVYHKNHHETLGCSPEQMYLVGLSLAGSRSHTVIPYNRDFLILTCPSTPKGTAHVTQHGVKINYLFYKSPVFNVPGNKGKDVPVRYEPYNRGIAYAYVENQWHELQSERYALFSQYTERAIQILSTQLNLQNRQLGKHQDINAERLAAFMRSVEGEELLEKQKKLESESQIYREKNSPKSTPKPVQDTPQIGQPTLVYTTPKLLEDF